MFLRKTFQRKQGPNWPDGASGPIVGHGAVTYDADAIALFARMMPEPDSSHKNSINTLIVALKAAGSWTEFDLLYVHAAHNSQAALLNWKAATFPLTEVNSPTFTADRGYTFDGATTELSSTFAPSTNGVNLTRDDHHIGAFVLTAGAGTATFDFGETTGTLLGVRCRTGTNGGVRCQTSSTLAGSAGGTVPIHTMGIRRVAGTQLHFRAGVQVNSSAAASSALSANTIGVGRAISLYSDRQVAITHLGGALTDPQAAATYTAFAAYLTSLGITI